MKSMPWNNKKWTTASPENAATLISWDDAVAFCKTLTLAERRFGWLDQSQEYTLPTEAEWEYACRAGTTTRFSCGDDRNVLKEFAWFEATTGAIWSAETEIKRSQVDFYEPYAHPVGRKNANPWGLYDMHGNVSEWCSDWFGDLAATEATDPQGPATGTAKGFRGGSWLDDASTCTSSHRDHLLTRRPNEASFSVGFRVVLRSAQQAAGR